LNLARDPNAFAWAATSSMRFSVTHFFPIKAKSTRWETPLWPYNTFKQRHGRNTQHWFSDFFLFLEGNFLDFYIITLEELGRKRRYSEKTPDLFFRRLLPDENKTMPWQWFKPLYYALTIVQTTVLCLDYGSTTVLCLDYGSNHCTMSWLWFKPLYYVLTMVQTTVLCLDYGSNHWALPAFQTQQNPRVATPHAVQTSPVKHGTLSDGYTHADA
jgi:hypothetical protein